MSSNMRRLFQLMHRASSFQHPVIAVSLDAEKAFDRVEWPYLFYALAQYGFGPHCLQWVKAIYHNPVSSVKTNNIISTSFQLFRSTRQGCPLSPILFTLALEPLSCMIRLGKEITGVTVGSHEFKLSMYADDVLLTQSIPKMIQIIESFGNLSGYKINWGKSETIPLSCHTFKRDLGPVPFIWKKDRMKYLGVTIGMPINKILELNLQPLLNSIKEDLKR